MRTPRAYIELKNKITINHRSQEQRSPGFNYFREEIIYGIFQSAVGTLQTLVVALGAGLGIWGAINLMEGYGNDNPGANAHVR